MHEPFQVILWSNMFGEPSGWAVMDCEGFYDKGFRTKQEALNYAKKQKEAYNTKRSVSHE